MSLSECRECGTKIGQVSALEARVAELEAQLSQAAAREEAAGRAMYEAGREDGMNRSYGPSTAWAEYQEQARPQAEANALCECQSARIICGASESSHPYSCTRESGHPGPHRACGSGTAHNLCEWGGARPQAKEGDR